MSSFWPFFFLLCILSPQKEKPLSHSAQIMLPVAAENRLDPDLLELTNIGAFGLWRIERPGVKGHFHTGVDIRRPSQNYTDEPVYPVSNGVVISMRDDGPYAQLIIAHEISGCKFWSLYEHIAGIKVEVDDTVDCARPIARFMTKEELDKFGWQFNHFHLEILKVSPLALRATSRHPQRFFPAYSLSCFTESELHRYYYDPMLFFREHLITVRTK